MIIRKDENGHESKLILSTRTFNIQVLTLQKSVAS